MDVFKAKQHHHVEDIINDCLSCHSDKQQSTLTLTPTGHQWNFPHVFGVREEAGEPAENPH